MKMFPSIKSPVVPVLVIAGALCVAGFARAWAGEEADSNPLSNVRGVTTIQPLEYVASETPQDWAAVADVVVVAEAIKEEAHDAGRSETTTNSNLIGRTVTVEAKKTLWTSPHAARETPSSFDLTVSGWVTDESGTSELNQGYGSRIEVGHTYVLALVWMDATCGEDPEPAGWAVIGSEGALPADDGILGRGEIGATVKEAVEISDLGPNSVLAATSGKQVDAVRQVLDAADRDVKRVPFREKSQLC